MLLTGYLVMELLNVYMVLCLTILVVGTEFVLNVVLQEWFEFDLNGWIKEKWKKK